MSAPRIYGRNRPFAASTVLEAVGNEIGNAKTGASMTWDDVGVAFGKSADVAASYRAGLSDMPLSAFVRGINSLGVNVGNAAMNIIGYQLVSLCPHHGGDDVSKLAPLARSVAFIAECTAPDSDGGADLTDYELRHHAKAIEDLFTIANDLVGQLQAARLRSVA